MVKSTGKSYFCFEANTLFSWYVFLGVCMIMINDFVNKLFSLSSIHIACILSQRNSTYFTFIWLYLFIIARLPEIYHLFLLLNWSVLFDDWTAL